MTATEPDVTAALTATLLTRRAIFAPPASFDRAALTCTATIASSAAVRRPPPAPDGSPESWSEILVLDAGAVDMSRLANAPVLMAHDQSRHVGVVTAARIERGQLVADLKFSPRADVAAIIDDIGAGILRQVSAGYRVERWRKTPAGWLAERWQPLEVSILPLAADGECLIRGATLEATMPDSVSVEPEASAPEVCGWTPADELALVRSASKLGIALDVVDQLRTRNLTIEAARDALLDYRAERDQQFETRPHHRVEMIRSHDDPQARAERMGEALFCRINPQHRPSDAAREFAGMSIPEIARACLEHAGKSTRGMSSLALISRAYTTTSDYPLVFADTIGRELRRIYDQAPRGVMQCAARTTNRDFRSKALLAFGDDIGLEKINQGGEYKHGVLTEAGERVKLETYGKIYGFSRQMQVNDDLSALQRIPQLFGMSARAKEDQVVVDLLASNPTMSDGTALFHATHGNLATSAGAPSEATLAAATLALRLQKGLSGKPINIEPAILLVPAALEVAALKLVTAIEAGTVDAVNPFAGKLRVVVDARLDAKSATAWYLLADPAAHDGLIVAYLEGQEGVTIETRAGWEIDGTEIKCRLDFGAAYIDWRSWFKNAG